MSTCPGRTLEKFLMWNFDLIVADDASANLSLQLAEATGVDTRRKRITAEQFAPIVATFEPYREQIERRLDNYNEEDCGSWRGYSSHVSEDVPSGVMESALFLIERQSA